MVLCHVSNLTIFTFCQITLLSWRHMLTLLFLFVSTCQDVFDLPFHMARDQIEESLRTKMASIKVGTTGLRFMHTLFSLLHVYISICYQARMTQLQDAQKGAEVTSEATERELELEAQLVEARSIIQEQVCAFLHFLLTTSE